MEKIKHFIRSDKGKDIIIIIIVILVGLASFKLGRDSKEGESSAVKNESPAQTISQTANVISSQNPVVKKTQIAPKTTAPVIPTIKTYFASNRGNKYYSADCSGGKTIKQENKIYFATKEEAEGAGYELSSSCK